MAIYLPMLDESQNFFGGNLYTYTLYLKALGWITQFVGHGIFEKRAPALLTNLAFAFIAPFFCSFEILHALFGIKDEEKKICDLIIESDIAFYRQAKGYAQRKLIKSIA
jgi:uncharacterized membrane protein YGL010W